MSEPTYFVFNTETKTSTLCNRHALLHQSFPQGSYVQKAHTEKYVLMHPNGHFHKKVIPTDINPDGLTAFIATYTPQ